MKMLLMKGKIWEKIFLCVGVGPFNHKNPQTITKAIMSNPRIFVLQKFLAIWYLQYVFLWQGRTALPINHASKS